jgi:hypothetical protein
MHFRFIGSKWFEYVCIRFVSGFKEIHIQQLRQDTNLVELDPLDEGAESLPT